MPEGSLTPAQYEILDVVWRAGPDGATATQIWHAVTPSRNVARTTVLRLVDRLEKRGWLRRRETGGAVRYVAAVSRHQTSAALANDFVQTFFDGSAANLVMSLLGTERLGADEIKRLRQILARTPKRAKPPQED